MTESPVQLIRRALFLNGSRFEERRVQGATLYRKPGSACGPDAPFVCVIGAFDGMHLGHRLLIDAARAEAEKRGLPLALVTFVPDPSEVLSRRNPEHLCTDDDRIRALFLTKPDLVIAFDFTWDFSRCSYEAFTLEVLGGIVKPRSIHVGEDFTFGADGAGSPSDIARLGACHGFDVHGHPLVEVGGAPVSSTRIRALLKAGRLREAQALLARHHMMRAGISCAQGGAVLSFDSRSCMPKAGVYACYAACATTAYPVVVRLDAASCSAHVVRGSLPADARSCSAVFVEPLPEADDSACENWVQHPNIMFASGEVGA